MASDGAGLGALRLRCGLVQCALEVIAAILMRAAGMRGEQQDAAMQQPHADIYTFVASSGNTRVHPVPRPQG